MRFSVHTGSALPYPRSGSHLWHHRYTPIARHGHSRQTHRASVALAERFCRTADRINPARVPRSSRRLERGSLTSDPASLCPLLQQNQNTPIIGQRCTNLAASSADRKHHLTCTSRGPGSRICPSLSFRYTHVDAVFVIHDNAAHRPHATCRLSKVNAHHLRLFRARQDWLTRSEDIGPRWAHLHSARMQSSARRSLQQW